jgi:hypothetical protein
MLRRWQYGCLMIADLLVGMLAVVNAKLFVRNRAMKVDLTQSLTQLHWEIAVP